MKKALSWVAVIGVLSLAGCGGGDGSSAEVSSFETTIVGAGGQSGKLSVTIDAGIAAATLVAADRAVSGTVAARGTLTLVGGGTASLAGTFDLSAGELRLSGDGYAFAGAVDGGELNGTYTAPGGGSGGFAGVDASARTVTVYCGTHSKGAGEAGIFNMVISSDGSITGLGDNRTTIRGSLSGTSITARGDGSSGGVSWTIDIVGTLSGDTISGTFVNRGHTADHGTWRGTRI